MHLFKLAVLSLFIVNPAHAYLDPGTGSMILQMAVAGVLSAMFTIKLYWQKFKSLFQKSEQVQEEVNPKDVPGNKDDSAQE